MAPDQSAILTGTELLVRSSRCDLAIAEFHRFVREQPNDWATAAMLADVFLRAANAAAADGQCSDAMAYLSVIANWSVSRGDRTGAAKLRTRIERLELADTEAQLELARASATSDTRLRASRARACVARGHAVAAAECLTPEMADGEPMLLLTIAEIQLRASRLDQGIALVERVIAEDPSFGAAVVQLGVELASHQTDAGFLLVDMVANAWAAQGRWRAAVGAFEDFVAQVPHYAPALVRLREIEAAASPPTEGKRVVLPFHPLAARVG